MECNNSHNNKLHFLGNNNLQLQDLEVSLKLNNSQVLLDFKQAVDYLEIKLHNLLLVNKTSLSNNSHLVVLLSLLHLVFLNPLLQDSLASNPSLQCKVQLSLQTRPQLGQVYLVNQVESRHNNSHKRLLILKIRPKHKLELHRLISSVHSLKWDNNLSKHLLFKA